MNKFFVTIAKHDDIGNTFFKKKNSYIHHLIKPSQPTNVTVNTIPILDTHIIIYKIIDNSMAQYLIQTVALKKNCDTVHIININHIKKTVINI